MQRLMRYLFLRWRYPFARRGRMTNIAIWDTALSEKQIVGLKPDAPQLTCTEHLVYFVRGNL